MTRQRGEPMPVKYWSSAGLMLTDWCNASCACCYLGCSPTLMAQMTLGEALWLWHGLVEASPHGCKVHLTGGEPFGDWGFLAELCRFAQAEELGPLEKIETNGFWATDEAIIDDRLAALDAWGMGALTISADPYHQQFVPIECVRLLASRAKAILGDDRVQVRWADWLETGFDTDTLSDAERRACFAEYLQDRRERLNGRAGDLLAELCETRPMEAFAERPCREGLLRSKHVHIGPGGWVTPGTCAGIYLGQARGARSVADVWTALETDADQRPIVGTLAASGPVGLARIAMDAGYEPLAGYASKCHLCWHVRRFLYRARRYPAELGPGSVYS